MNTLTEPKAEPIVRDVHVLAVVRVKVPGIAAADDEAACRQAEDRTAGLFHELFDREAPCPGVASTEFDEDVPGFVVDQLRQSQIIRMTCYGPDAREVQNRA